MKEGFQAVGLAQQSIAQAHGVLMDQQACRLPGAPHVKPSGGSKGGRAPVTIIASPMYPCRRVLARLCMALATRCSEPTAVGLRCCRRERPAAIKDAVAAAAVMLLQMADHRHNRRKQLLPWRPLLVRQSDPTPSTPTWLFGGACWQTSVLH